MYKRVKFSLLLITLSYFFLQCGHKKTQPREELKTKSAEKIGSITSDYSSGFYRNDITLNLTSEKEGKLYYTLNGKTPIPGSSYTLEVNGPIETKNLSHTKLIEKQTAFVDDEVFGWKEGYINPTKGHSMRVARIFNGEKKEEAVFNYIVGDYEFADITCSVMINSDENGLISDSSGIFTIGDTTKGYKKGKENYYQKGKRWERASNFQYYDDRGNQVLNANVGLSVFGYMTRQSPQKSLKFSARKKYGTKKITYPFFENGPKQNNKILLRSAYSGWGHGVYKDCLVNGLCSELNIEVPKQKPVIVFLNGEYWGIMFLGEKVDHNYLKEHFDNPTNISIVRDNAGLDYGHSDTYLETHNFAFKNDLGISSNYEKFCSVIDIDNYIDWIIAEVFFQNSDWPCNNTKLWISDQSTKWRNFLIDMDAAFAKPEKNYINRLYNFSNQAHKRHDNRCSFVFNNLMRNRSFRQKFSSRYNSLLKNYWTTENISKMVTKYEVLFSKKYMTPYQQLRWKYPNENKFEDFQELLQDWAESRPSDALENLEEFMEKTESLPNESFVPCSYQFEKVSG